VSWLLASCFRKQHASTNIAVSCTWRGLQHGYRCLPQFILQCVSNILLLCVSACSQTSAGWLSWHLNIPHPLHSTVCIKYGWPPASPRMRRHRTIGTIARATAFEAWGKMQCFHMWDQGSEAQAKLPNKWQRYSSHAVWRLPVDH
jgi:hypothetical protein